MELAGAPLGEDLLGGLGEHPARGARAPWTSTCLAAKRAVEVATVQASGMVERGVGKGGGVVGVKRGGPMEWWIRPRRWRPSPLADPKIKLEPGRDLRHQSNHVIQSFRLSVRRPIAMYTSALEPGCGRPGSPDPGLATGRAHREISLKGCEQERGEG
jgi:hypothetical protein